MHVAQRLKVTETKESVPYMKWNASFVHDGRQEIKQTPRSSHAVS